MKKFLSLVLALVMTMSLVTVSAGAKDFTDDSKINYEEAVAVMSDLKVLGGYTDGDFRPDANLTRGAAAKIICNMILGPTTASALRADAATFKDVPTDHTFAGYIAFCAQQGIISGYADGSFRPAAPLTYYAFMKMLLGALGYDAKIEGYVGANWSVQVAKRALNIGLNDGLVDTFNGVKTVTREEACLYAFNTLKADMVDYDSRTTVTVGGSEVVIAGSKAEPVANTGRTDGNIEPDRVMQFAEKYFTKLSADYAEDDFFRPCTEWTNGSKTVGSYMWAADAEYTTTVKSGAIYKDLGLSKAVDADDMTIYTDGAPSKAVALERGSKINMTDSGNGVLTQVWYDEDSNTARVTAINTYVSVVDRFVKATSNKDAYIVIGTAGSAPVAPASNLKFETEDFEEETVVLYTYSFEADAVESVVEAEMVTGTVTEAQNKVDDGALTQNVTLDGDKYSSSAKFAGDEVGNITPKNDYNVYLDEYGYMIMIERVADLSSDYALVLDTKHDSQDWNIGTGMTGSANQAKLVFADGTAKIVDTAKNYNSGTNTTIANGTVVTWKADEDGVYTLRPVTNAGSFTSIVNSTSFELLNGRALIKRDAATTYDVYSNSGTVVVIYNDDDDAWETYTGIKNVPTVKSNGQAVRSYTYVKGGMVKIMFIVPMDYSTQVETAANALMYLVADSRSNLISNGNSQYYIYKGIVDGEIIDVKVDVSLKAVADNGGFFSRYKIDKYGVYTDLTYIPYGGGGTAPAYMYGTGISKTSLEYTVSFENTPANPDVFARTFTVDKDAEIYYVDEDNNIEVSSYGAIGRDYNDRVSVIVEDNMVTTLVIEYVDDTVVTPPAGDKAQVVESSWGVSVNGVTVEEAAIYTKKVGTDADALAAAVANAEELSLSSVASASAGSSYTFTVASPSANQKIGVYANANAVSNPVNALTSTGFTASLMPGQVVVIMDSNGSAPYYYEAYVIVR